ncbi:MAG: Rrf2 family transcriptional regulator, partial [Oscillospiraceae bacterium]|nr:Rrf2 family transcriptional regulator [Oscillospiraceae bacterium]
MQISSRFTVALHIFTCVEVFKDSYKVTSDFLAESINTNPVIIRKILAQLKNAGLITVARGTGGITVNRPLEEITFYEVYQAIEPVENGDLFHFHEAPNPECPV